MATSPATPPGRRSTTSAGTPGWNWSPATLLEDARTVVESLADATLAADWRERIGRERAAVEHPPGDHPALASAYRGGAAHLLTYDEGLRSAKTGASLQSHMSLSVRPPDAFARLFDPEALYEAVEGGTYPGPDRDPRV